MEPVSTINTHSSPLSIRSVRPVTNPLATDTAVQTFRYGCTSGRTAGSFSSSLSRLNSFFALEYNYYEYVASALNYNIECSVVYVAHNDCHYSSALTTVIYCTWSSGCVGLQQSVRTEEVPSTIVEYCVVLALC